jgi:hypothetical protein
LYVHANPPAIILHYQKWPLLSREEETQETNWTVLL